MINITQLTNLLVGHVSLKKWEIWACTCIICLTQRLCRFMLSFYVPAVPHITDWCNVTIMLLKSSLYGCYRTCQCLPLYNNGLFNLFNIRLETRLYFQSKVSMLTVSLSLLQNLPSLHWISVASSKQTAKDFEQTFLGSLMHNFNTQLKFILIWVQRK